MYKLHFETSSFKADFDGDRCCELITQLTGCKLRIEIHNLSVKLEFL
jgi:hypothetical protein